MKKLREKRREVREKYVPRLPPEVWPMSYEMLLEFKRRLEEIEDRNRREFK